MKAPITLFLAAATAACFFFACGHSKPKVEVPMVELDAGAADAAPEVDSAPPPSLYDKLGGKAGVSAIIESLMGNVTADKRVSKPFAKTTGTKLDHFKQMLSDQICEAAGGGCTYSGKPMKEAHKGMGITEAQFTAFLEDLTLALEEKQVAKEDQDALLAKLGATRDDIVEKKGKK